MSRLTSMWLCAGLSVCLLCGLSSAATIWQHDPATTGDWFDAANWNSGVPTSAVSAQIDNGGTAVLSTGSASVATVTVYANSMCRVDGGAMSASSIQVSRGSISAGTAGRFVVNGGSITTPTGQFGCYNGDGVLTVNDGTVTINNLSVGKSSSGTVYINGGKFVGGTEQIGDPGSGKTARIVQTGGTHVLSNGKLFVGSVNGEATYELSGGEFGVVGGATALTDMRIGYLGKGTFIQTGGRNVVPEDEWMNARLVIGSYTDCEGVYDLSGTGELVGSASVGMDKYSTKYGTIKGTIYQHGGKADLTNLSLGGLRSTNYVVQATGTYLLTDGVLNVSNYLMLANSLIDNPYYPSTATATFTQSGGTCTVKEMWFAYNSACSGTYTLSGGTLNVGKMNLGGGGTNTFYYNGGQLTTGTLDMSGGGNLIATQNWTCTGRLSLGGAIRMPSNVLTIGSPQAALTTASGGGAIVASRLVIENATYNSSTSLTIGQMDIGLSEVSGSQAVFTYKQYGTLPASVINIGPSGTMKTLRNWNYVGTLNVDRGAVIMPAYELTLGSATSAVTTATISGGILNTGTLTLDNATCSILSGTVSVNLLNVGPGSTPGKNGTFNIAGKAADITFAGAATVGTNGVFTSVPGGRIKFTGGLFDNQSTSAANLAGLGHLTMCFDNAAAAVPFEIAGKDNGASWSAFQKNFTLSAMRIGDVGAATVSLKDVRANNSGSTVGSEVLYVKSLSVAAGSTLELNGLKVYCLSLTNNGTIVTGGGSVTQVAPIDALGAGAFYGAFSPSGGDYGKGMLSVHETVNLTAGSMGGATPFSGAKITISSSLQSDASAGGLAAGNFSGGVVTILDSLNNPLLGGTITGLQLREVAGEQGLLSGTGIFQVTGGSLEDGMLLPDDNTMRITFQISADDVSDFSGTFGGLSDVSLAPVPEPASMTLLAISALAMLRTRRRT